MQNRHSRILLRDLLRGRMREVHRVPGVLEAEVPSGRMPRLHCKDYLKKNMDQFFCEKWHLPECLFYKSDNGCKFGVKCPYAHRQFDEQPSKKVFKKNGDQSAVAMLKSKTTIGLRMSRYGASENLHRFCGRDQTY